MASRDMKDLVVKFRTPVKTLLEQCRAQGVEMQPSHLCRGSQKTWANCQRSLDQAERLAARSAVSRGQPIVSFFFGRLSATMKERFENQA